MDVKIMKKRLLGIFMIVLFASFTIGCEQKVEMVNLAKVMAIGIDSAPDGNYIVSIRTLSEGSSKKSSGSAMQKGSKDSTSSAVYVETGDTILQAVNKLNKQLGKEIRFSHNKVIIIGEEIAWKSIYNILDFSQRLYQMRPNVPVLIAKGTALEIMKIETTENPLPPSAIEDILTQQDKIGYAPYSTNLDITKALLSKSSAPVVAVINKNTNDLLNTDSFKIEGTAVFNKDKLVGYMNEKETRGLEWVVGRIRNGAVVLGDIKYGNITTIVLDSSAKITPLLGKDDIVIQIDIKNRSNIREMTADLDIMKNPNMIDELNEAQNKVIKYEVEQAVNVAQKNLREDIFGFGQVIYRKYPKEWKKIKDKWDEEFPDCKVNVTVHSSIKRPGSLNRTVK